MSGIHIELIDHIGSLMKGERESYLLREWCVSSPLRKSYAFRSLTLPSITDMTQGYMDICKE